MMTPDEVIARIRDAFSPNEYPGDWCLKRGTEGEEPYLVEDAFRGKTDWRTLDAGFLDQAPDGYSSALSFFSDEAFRFYLPAYLMADVEGRLRSANPAFHLTHGLDDASRNELVNPRRYGARTWFHVASGRLAVFSREEVSAIISYLEHRIRALEPRDSEVARIRQALANYWRPREQTAPPRAALFP